jgi:hypothetical protein
LQCTSSMPYAPSRREHMKVRIDAQR